VTGPKEVASSADFEFSGIFEKPEIANSATGAAAEDNCFRRNTIRDRQKGPEFGQRHAAARVNRARRRLTEVSCKEFQ